MEILNIPTGQAKDVFTAKTDQGYVGCVQTQVCFYFTTEVFNNALQAANAARKLRKNLSAPQATLTDVKTKILKKPKKSSKNSKKIVTYPNRLYTQAEVEAMPLLRFREVWIILNGDDYVVDCLNYEKKELVKYCKQKEKAKLFLCHEEAKSMMRTLRGVIGPGFNLMRMFINAKDFVN
jgi:hypothetical protein